MAMVQKHLLYRFRSTLQLWFPGQPSNGSQLALYHLSASKSKASAQPIPARSSCRCQFRLSLAHSEVMADAIVFPFVHHQVRLSAKKPQGDFSVHVQMGAPLDLPFNFCLHFTSTSWLWRPACTALAFST